MEIGRVAAILRAGTRPGQEASWRPPYLPIIEGLQKRQDLLDAARAYGWSEDTLRFALDVAA